MAQKLLEQSVTMRGGAHGTETSRTVSDRSSHWEYLYLLDIICACAKWYCIIIIGALIITSSGDNS